LGLLLSLAHFVGLALGVGAATVKLAVLARCRANPDLLPIYFGVARIITALIVAGLVLLTLSGIGWLLLGYPLTPLLGLKLLAVAMLWGLGPYIDKVIEPRLRNLAAPQGGLASAPLAQLQTRHLSLEALANGLFYAAVVIGVLL
jgi:hypothetical protein